MFCEKGVRRTFAKFTRKQLCQSPFFIKKSLWYRCFPVNFAEFLRTPFLMEHLLWLLLFTDGAIPLHNFEFWKKKKIVPLLTKQFFSRRFQSYKIFHERVSCVKNGTQRQFDQIKYVFKIWLNRSEKCSIADVWFGSRYASVSKTLHLTFLKRI